LPASVMRAATPTAEKCLTLSVTFVHQALSPRHHDHLRVSAEVFVSAHQLRISYLGASKNDRIDHVTTLTDLQIGRTLCHGCVHIDDRGPPLSERNAIRGIVPLSEGGRTGTDISRHGLACTNPRSPSMPSKDNFEF